ncbi:MurR/RpiR family transcriptional regulator [Enterococcus sp. BWM-S5]|uniref:MurR/RpiR family transcriptional regulator n=1 Tax=Enterococcus larvae TaxID=2794352 RepID=A0ABS4CPA6_9ENTE|nr:MurR/RpiR family transcriptional regulator [Enterococcus larvae]MBP1048411.1 MurR/RpiR family transcriptional regulator [Enterococcus larvae]
MLFLDYIPELNPLEYDIYHYIANNLKAVSYMRIRDLAEETHTSTASIQRFCHKFECNGFAEFKVKLQLYADSLQKAQVSDVDEAQYIHFLERVNDPFLKDKIEKAVDMLYDKGLVLFLGSGSSEMIAGYGMLYFSNLSQTALRIEDPSNYPIEWFPDDVLQNTCVIALSVTGETKEIIHYIKRLNTKKCPIISITNGDSSTISRMSDLNIPYTINRETIYKTSDNHDKTIELTSQLPALFLIEKIAKRLRLRKNI